jgi:hypothetical protein
MVEICGAVIISLIETFSSVMMTLIGNRINASKTALLIAHLIFFVGVVVVVTLALWNALNR